MSFLPSFLRIAVPSIDVKTIYDNQSSEKKHIIVDVRTEQEHANASIPESILISLDVLEQKIESVVPDKNTEIYVHCNTGIRSSHATKILRNMGYQNSYNVTGGIFAWRQAGYPVKEN